MKKLLCALFACFCTSHAAHATSDINAFDYDFEDVTGEKISLSHYQGHVVLLVNTASECGFTPQYEGLQTLYDTYKDRGLVVIAVPSNDFGGQEPGSNEEIKTFCETRFHISFPIMGKVAVTGDNRHPFFGFVQEKLGVLATPKWNFYKYLIAPDGQLVDYFSSKTTPDSDTLIKAIEALLPKAE